MSEWKTIPINEVADVIMWQSPSSSSYNEEGIGYPFLQGCAEFGKRNPIVKFYCSDPKKIVPNDSILISVRAPVGATNRVDSEYCIGRGLAGIYGRIIDQDLLYYKIIQHTPDLERVSQGSTFLAINTSDLNTLKITIPTSFNEQRKIARILSTVDAVIEKTEAAIAKYKAIKAGMMRDLFTRGIDLTTGKLRPSYEESPHLYKQTELRWVPKEWDVVRIDEILKSPIRDFGSFAMTNLITFEESGVIFIKSEMVQDGFIDYSHPFYISDEVHNLLFISMVFAGDILFTKIGAIGRVATYDGRYGVCNSNAATAKIQVKPTRCVPDYIAYKLTSTRVINEFEKSVISTPPRINLGDINSLKIKLPKKNEQDEIAKRIKSIINKIEIESVFLSKYQQLKQALMSDLLTGRVPVKYKEEKAEVM